MQDLEQLNTTDFRTLMLDTMAAMCATNDRYFSAYEIVNVMTQHGTGRRDIISKRISATALLLLKTHYLAGLSRTRNDVKSSKLGGTYSYRYEPVVGTSTMPVMAKSHGCF